MNDHIHGFKDCAHLAGEICQFSTSKMIREFGLGDFLDNVIRDDDDVPTIAVKAIGYFCEEPDPGREVFKFGVLTVGSFLNTHAKRGKQPPQQALIDLVQLLKQKPNEQQVRAWISSHFG